MDGAYLSSGLRLLGVNGTVGEFLFPTVDDHFLDLVTVQFVDVVCLADELDEGGHGGWHFGDENHCLKVFWENTFQGGHSCEMGDNFFQCKRRVGVIGNGGGHRACELLVDGGDTWLSIFFLQSLPDV